MRDTPSPLLRVPRAFLEHFLPYLPTTPGLSLSSSYIDPISGLPQSFTLGRVDRWSRTGAPSQGGLTPLTPASRDLSLENPVILGSPRDKSLGQVQDSVLASAPGFTLDHFTTLSGLLFLAQGRDGVTLTFNQLFRALTGSASLCSGHHRTSLKSSLSSLEDLYLSISSPSSSQPTPLFQRLITLTPTTTAPVFGQRAPAFIVHFAPALLSCLHDPRASALFHFHAFRSLRSRLARSLYLTLSTWAHYHRATSPATAFRITLGRLISHLGSSVPRFLSQRRAYFHGHRRQSLLEGLQGLPTPHGFLQLSLTPATSIDDDCLHLWLSAQSQVSPQGVPAPLTPASRDLSPKNPVISSNQLPHVSPQEKFQGHTHPSHSSDPLSSFRHLKIYQAWITSGRTETDFVSRVRAPSVTLSPEDLELLHTARITPSRCQNFLLLSKKLLPQRTWLDLLGEAKYAALSPTPPRNPTGKLINEILTSLRSGI